MGLCCGGSQGNTVLGEAVGAGGALCQIGLRFPEIVVVVTQLRVVLYGDVVRWYSHRVLCVV